MMQSLKIVFGGRNLFVFSGSTEDNATAFILKFKAIEMIFLRNRCRHRLQHDPKKTE